ncbi:MAG: hypothetical protein R2850_00330 [Bacteroidia bacterium]
MRLFHRHIIALLLLLPLSAGAQLEFNMSDTTVHECKGILFDAGGEGGEYPHNSDLTFTICLDGQGTLTLSLKAFALR